MKLDSSSSLNSSLSFTLQSLKLVNVDSSTSSSLRYNLLFFFFFFHFIKSGLIHSLYFTVSSHLKPLKLTLSTSPARPSSSLDPHRRSASTHFSSADPLQVSLCHLHVDALGFWFGYTLPPIRRSTLGFWFGSTSCGCLCFYFWYMIFCCCSGLLAWYFGRLFW